MMGGEKGEDIIVDKLLGRDYSLLHTAAKSGRKDMLQAVFAALRRSNTETPKV